MKKKITLVATSVLLVAAMVIGGTLAYFTDTEKATNTMTIGNIEINIEEWQYGANGWQDYDDNIQLYPLESEQGIKLYNKSVRTYNTSESQDDAYIRSFVLIEKNVALSENYKNDGDCCVPGIHIAYDMPNGDADTYTSSKDGRTQYASKPGGSLNETVTVDNDEYWVVWYVAASEKAIPYDAALSSLHSVYMDKNIENDQIKGWDDDVKVIVFSQGIQAEGLTHAEAMAALGDVTVANVEEWVANAEVAAINDMPDNP